MPDLIEPSSSVAKRNPLFWIILLAIGLIVYIVFGSDRGANISQKEPKVESVIVETMTDNDQSGRIDRNLLVPPGMRARQLIEQVRAEGQPFPLDMIFEKASEYHNDGSLADAHLLFFFSAREGHIASMMKMAEMSDPMFFRAEDSLLDHADALQSYKWYQKVAERGELAANDRIRNLQEWAVQESESGNSYARQLLLVVQ